MAKNKKKDEVIFEEVEPMFVVLYNEGNGKMHEVILPYEQQKAVGSLLMRMNSDDIPVNSEVCLEMKLQKYKIAIKKEEVSSE